MPAEGAQELLKTGKGIEKMLLLICPLYKTCSECKLSTKYEKRPRLVYLWMRKLRLDGGIRRIENPGFHSVSFGSQLWEQLGPPAV